MVLTAGTLIPFFWMVVILGHRRQRNFERIFFFLCLALTFYFGASLLALNAELYYGNGAASIIRFSWTILCLGLWSLPSLLLHLHVEYASVRNLMPSGMTRRLSICGAYFPAILLIPQIYAALRMHSSMDFLLPSNTLGMQFQIWLILGFIGSSAFQHWFAKTAPDREQKKFHRGLQVAFAMMAFYIVAFHGFYLRTHLDSSAEIQHSFLIELFALLPLIALIRNVEKFNFLQIGRQRNLMFAVFAAFVALLYLSFVRRASMWADEILPPEATAAILLFLPVIFFEPLQRLLRRSLQQTAQLQMEHAHRMMGPILDVARLGNSQRLHAFVENWIAEQLQLAEAVLVLGQQEIKSISARSGEEVFPIQQSGKPAGFLRVKAYGAMLSGETVAALEYLSEQLPGALDLCRLIEEKLQLERELAERERLAVLGQMAASISHNLKNPLGSIKTILQVQMEGTELPESLRGETKMVLDEIGRLSSKLNQLLQFSKPAVRGGSIAGTSDARAVIEEVAGMLRHEAERKGIMLDVKVDEGDMRVAAISEALNDIVSNLVVNGLEAAARGGRVVLSASVQNGTCRVFVEDDGPGIPEGAREKILQPFFTTKSQGTGLGLAIVARRVTEFGGKLDWVSPTKNGRGTRFDVELPTAERSNEAMK